MYAWGAQLERAGFPTSYIPNIGGSAGFERKADLVKTVDTAWYSGSGATYFVKAHLPYDDLIQQTLFLSAGGGADNIELLKPAWQQLAFFMQAGGSSSLDEWNGEAWGSGNSKRIALAGQGDDFAYATEGTVKKTSSSGGWPAAPVEFQLGQEWGDHFLNGHITSLKYYPHRLTNRTLETITTP